MIRRLFLFRPQPFDIVCLPYEGLTTKDKKRITVSVSYYKSQGYFLYLEKVLHHRDHTPYRVLQFAPNQGVEPRFVFLFNSLFDIVN